MRSLLQGIALSFHSRLGRQYAVEYSLQLSPATWTELPGGAVTGTWRGGHRHGHEFGGVVSWFYRVRLLL